MREIKYQAYVKLNPTGRCQMFDVEGIDWKHNRIETAFGEYSLVGNVLRQFTGLCDKNRKKIYEGDILKTDHEEMLSVYWSEDWSMFGVQRATPFSLMFWANDSEVTGNIYENPELVGASVQETSSTANG